MTKGPHIADKRKHKYIAYSFKEVQNHKIDKYWTLKLFKPIWAYESQIYRQKVLFLLYCSRNVVSLCNWSLNKLSEHFLAKLRGTYIFVNYPVDSKCLSLMTLSVNLPLIVP